MANTHEWTPGELITASKLNAIESFLTNISTNFVSTQGSTISGNIVYKLTNVDLMQTNNGVTDKLYPAIAIFQDDNEKSFARVEGSVWSDNEEEDFKGSTWVNIWARNYKTSDGTEVTNALRLGVNKEGELLVKLTDKEKEAWRRALGIISDDYMTIDNAILHETGSTEAQSIFTPLTTTHYFGGESGGGQWWQGKNNALFRNTAKCSSETYYPTISMDSPNGSWTIGTYQDNSLRFVYTLSLATSNTDTYNYSINANGVFSGTASKITDRTLTIGSTGKTFNGTANVSWSLSEIGAAAATHYHSAWHITSGTLPVVRGGTGAASPSAARANLEAAALNHNHTMNDLTGTLQIEKGGTGAITEEAARTALGITPANIGAASASHTHSASNITSGIIPIIRGGTGANDIISAQRNLGIDTGYVSIGDFGGDTDAKKCKTATISFNKAFSKAPNVVIGLAGGPTNGDPTPKWGRVSVRVITNSITTTGFKYQVSSYGADTFSNLCVCWVAIGQATIVA